MHLTLICRDPAFADGVREALAPRHQVTRLAPGFADDRLDVATALAVRRLQHSAAVLVRYDTLTAALLDRLHSLVSGLGIPVVALCGGGGEEEASALTAGADAALRLPLRADVLEALICNHRHRWHTLQVQAPVMRAAPADEGPRLEDPRPAAS